jgi:soluble lytic murein transglycosylase-like protein
MIRTLVSGAFLASTFALPALADADVYGFLRSATPEQRKELREEMRDVREAKTPRDKREERAELREEIREAREERAAKRAQINERLIEGRSSVRGAAPGSMQSLVARYAEANGVPAHVAHGVVMVESRYNAKATGPGGYIGLMQIGYRTAKGMGYTGSRAGLYDPETNLKYGMRYLGEAYRQAGGNLCGAVSKYQGGHGVRGVTRAGAVYCGKVKTYMTKAAPAEKKQLVAERENGRS